MARSLKEWVGRTDDERAPPRIRQRIFDDCGGKCHICGNAIVGKRWALDHVKALVNGGENRQSNLKPVHIACHAEKTAADVAEKAAIAAKRQAHLRIVPDGPKMQGQPFPVTKSRAEKKQRAPKLDFTQRKQLFEARQ
jgi:5-methylcytosine-specific restriction protein A